MVTNYFNNKDDNNIDFLVDKMKRDIGGGGGYKRKLEKGGGAGDLKCNLVKMVFFKSFFF